MDGDLYYICWDNSIANVSSQHPWQRPQSMAARSLPRSQSRWRANGLLRQGKLYRAGEKVADESPLGLNDPDLHQR